MGENIEITVTLSAPRTPGPRPLTVGVRGTGPGALRFTGDGIVLGNGNTGVSLVSGRPVPLRIAKLKLAIDWTTSTGEPLSPARSENVVYVTMDVPRDDQEGYWPEDGVTLKRMDLAVTWVEPMRTLKPHSIVRALMAKFPYYSLKPSPRVPREYHHPTYYNEVGGAWGMADYVEEAGECQAIVRLVRAILRQLGVPGEARALLVWADPYVNGGMKAVTAYWDDNPSAGLSTTRVVNGRRWIAALVDGPVEEGRDYPASHTIQNGRPSPGLNRYEACLEFSYGGETRYHGGGAGIFRAKEDVLRAFWGLVWVSGAPAEGFRVEEIVTRY
ncbi:MAG: hypothetical protein QM820_13085 [Minicystis sp.]